MPELPEVETIRRYLEPIVRGRAIVAASIRDARLTAPEPPEAVAAALVGRRIAALLRRGKYLDVVFECGNHLLVHLRMTGSFRHAHRGGCPDDPYVRAVVSLDDASDIIYRDVRRFGTWKFASAEAASEYLAVRLGPEPLDGAFTGRWLATALGPRRAPVKAVLLDQRVVAGMGNIYADEALWWARIHPLRPASSLSRTETLRLARAVRAVLRRGVAREGATLRDYRAPDGRSGSMQEAFSVYGRAGGPCLRCGAPIARTVAAGRGTHFCPRCQALRPR